VANPGPDLDSLRAEDLAKMIMKCRVEIACDEQLLGAFLCSTFSFGALAALAAWMGV